MKLRVFQYVVLSSYFVAFGSMAERATLPEHQPLFGKSYEPGTLQKTLFASTTPEYKEPTASQSGSGLNLDAPQLEAKPNEAGDSGLSLNFGGALDIRGYFPRTGGPTETHLGQANMDIHVAELFLTTNVGDNISVLAEQLLVTSPMGSTVGQDHGFVYAIFSNIPFLPETWSLKVGRMRFRYGIDAKLDSPANVLRSSVYKSLGTITDKGLELSGYGGAFEWSLGIANGVDMIEVPVTAKNGDEIMAEMEVRNGSKPIYARLAYEATDWLALGISGFTGKTYPVYSRYGFAMHDMLFNGHTGMEKLIYKNRYAVDAKIKLSSRWDFSGEYSGGTDRESGETFNVYTLYGRLDYRIRPGKLTAQLQYEYFNDGREDTMVEGMNYDDSGNIGLGLTYYLTDQAWIRVAGLVDDRGIFRSKDGGPNAPEYMGVVQTLLSF